jgi:hypothetical protein
MNVHDGLQMHLPCRQLYIRVVLLHEVCWAPNELVVRAINIVNQRQIVLDQRSCEVRELIPSVVAIASTGVLQGSLYGLIVRWARRKYSKCTVKVARIGGAPQRCQNMETHYLFRGD